MTVAAGYPRLPDPRVPWWLSNGSAHTVVGGLPLRTLMVQRRAARFLREAVELTLDGGNGVRLTGMYSRGESGVLVVLIHGWEGSAQSAYLVSAAAALNRAGHTVVRLQLRDHGDSHALNEGPFLGSEYGEVLAAVADVQARFQADRTVVAGYSLGGNFAVRLAAFAAEQSVRLSAAFAICPPVRPLDAARAISASPLYNRYFSHRWKRSIRAKMAAFASWREHRSLLDIDDIIAMHEAFVPLFTRFANAEAYFESYALNSAVLGQLSCPTEMVLAADDPVCPVNSLDEVARLPGLTTTVVPQGGHCAFLDGLSMTSWLDDYLVSRVAEVLRGADE